LDTRAAVQARPAGAMAAAVARRLAQALLLAIVLAGATAFATQLAALPDHPLADMTHVTRWARNIEQDGIEHAYAGSYPETYLIYPPGMAYVYQMAVRLAQWVPPPPGVAPEDWLRICIKLLPIAGHTALAITLFCIVAAAGGYWSGLAAAVLYSWNPAALFDVAYWGQADSLHTVLLAIALGALFVFPSWWPLRSQRRWRLAAQMGGPVAGLVVGAALVAAGLTKPQAWVFLPLVLWVTFRRSGPLGLAAAAVGGAAAGWWIIQPWVRAGTLADMTSVFTNLTQVMPSVSANGHNLWWLKLPGVALAVFDSTPVGGFGSWVAPPLITHATLGRLGFGLLALIPLLRLTGPLSVKIVFAGAAYTAAAYFMTITQVHENHLFAAVPFLAAAAALDALFLVPLATVTVCAFANMALHDFLIGEWLAAELALRLPWQDPLALQTANAALNVAGFAAFTALILRRPAAVPQSAGALRWRARFVLLAGLAMAGGALAALLAAIRRPDVAVRLWDRLAETALASGPIEAKLGHRTPAETLLVRAAFDFANLLYTLAGIAAVVGAVAALAGAWWLLCSWAARRERRASKDHREALV
jgi:hypothetical protein